MRFVTQRSGGTDTLKLAAAATPSSEAATAAPVTQADGGSVSHGTGVRGGGRRVLFSLALYAMSFCEVSHILMQ